jgi:hypothetical protein
MSARGDEGAASSILAASGQKAGLRVSFRKMKRDK